MKRNTRLPRPRAVRGLGTLCAALLTLALLAGCAVPSDSAESADTMTQNTSKVPSSQVGADGTAGTEYDEETTAVPDQETDAETEKPLIIDGTWSQEGLTYTSNGDGTCSVSLRDCADVPYLRIPETSPDGDTVTAISAGYTLSVNCPGLKALWMPDTLLCVRGYALSDCRTLEQIRWSPRLSELGDCAFKNSGLWDLVLPETLTKMGKECFAQCLNLETVVLPSGLDCLPKGCFLGDGYLRAVTLSEGLRIIGPEAFSNCNRLKTLPLPESLMRIETEAFHVCSQLKEMTIPPNVNYVGVGAFAGCSKLTSLTFEEGALTEIGSYAFYHSGLSEVTLPKSLILLGDHVFSDSTLLTSVIIPPDGRLEVIGDYAFEKDTGLTSLILPPSLKSIGEGAFSLCTELTAVTFAAAENNRLRTIGAKAFMQAESLAELDLSVCGELEIIGERAFARCGSLETLRLPGSLRSIAGYVFDMSDPAVFFDGTVKEWDRATFDARWQSSGTTVRVVCRDGELKR